MFKEITSSENKTYKSIKKLSEQRSKSKDRLFICEGLKEVREAISSDFEIQSVVASDSFVMKNDVAEFEKLNCDKFKFNDKMFKNISDTVSPQGILCVIKEPEHTLEIKKSGFYFYCDAIADPGNLGTIIRVCDAANVDGIILSEGCVDVYSSKVVRSTMGSLFHIPVYKDNKDRILLSSLKENGIKVVSGALYNSTEFYSETLTGGIVLIVGNESHGISQQVLDMSDVCVKIPILGKAESLNAASAASIMVYEALRQRNNL